MTPQEEKYADRIAKLLRKAESTTPEEAEALVAKAQELMVQYAISEELVRRARGDNEKTQEEIVEEHIDMTGIYRDAFFQIGSVIAKANDCRTLIQKMTAQKEYKTSDGTVLYEARPATTRLFVIGHKSDVDRARMLNASVQIQATSAQVKWNHENAEAMSWMSPMQKFKEQREFLYGFASGLQSQLHEARKRGMAAAGEAEATRLADGDTVSHDNAAAAASSVSLVLRSKKERVDEWMDKSYGKLRSVSSRRSSGSHSARSEGNAAGRRADAGTNGGRVGGGRKELGR